MDFRSTETVIAVKATIGKRRHIVDLNRARIVVFEVLYVVYELFQLYGKCTLVEQLIRLVVQ